MEVYTEKDIVGGGSGGGGSRVRRGALMTLTRAGPPSSGERLATHIRDYSGWDACGGIDG
eukprot:CAMPEP_0204108964 /NCGR_PEP_ID=MMETSP0361-20130328/1018_1 /ASSEMBLY_ACC=CAM_ASM_000343 /TAXON_ID=268821 /ORGANISM="Scrippsiella Hangoei, Strain SHTV-5" /LENGTH=59 /DNA_ID=CAMNT_0051058659 /DNA_START=31 /DNA_END=207 /DNA_ORIENTATION=+